MVDGAHGESRPLPKFLIGFAVNRLRRPTTRVHAGDDAGWVTLWLLGLALTILALGGLSLDLWRVFGERRELAGMVDAAAAAGVSGIDTERFRATGEVRLDPVEAEALVAANLAAQADLVGLSDVAVETTPTAVTVSASDTVELTLIRALVPAGPVTVRVVATAEPARSP